MPARAAAVLIAVAAALLGTSAQAHAAQLLKIGDFPSPTYVTAPPAAAHKLFVVEKAGKIELLHDGVRKTFLDISGGVVASGEQGLLSMAFAPDYRTSGRFYVYYTAPRSPDGNVVTIAEYRRSAADADVADPASKRIVLTVQHPTNTNHDGGQLQFGPDGLLYVGTGDGGSGNDPPNNAQNVDSLLGKLLRIDPRQSGTLRYTVPADNPFVGKPGADEVYALGLRNPWRFSFDRTTGDLAIADVGQGAREEVDFAPSGSGTAAGANYGWRCREGFIAGTAVCTSPGPFVEPVFDYDHSSGGCAIIGGYVVRHNDLGSLLGRYVYADLCVGDIRSLALGQPRASGDSSTGLGLGGIMSFGEDSCGHLYAAGSSAVYAVVDGALTPCPDPPSKDVTPPRLVLGGAASQRLSNHRSVFVRVTCDEPCTATVSGALAVPHAGRTFTLPTVTRTLAANTEVRFVLPVSRKAAEVARRSIANGHGARTDVKVVARDAAGNRRVAFKHVRTMP